MQQCCVCVCVFAWSLNLYLWTNNQSQSCLEKGPKELKHWQRNPFLFMNVMGFWSGFAAEGVSGVCILWSVGVWEHQSRMPAWPPRSVILNSLLNVWSQKTFYWDFFQRLGSSNETSQNELMTHRHASGTPALWTRFPLRFSQSHSTGTMCTFSVSHLQI